MCVCVCVRTVYASKYTYREIENEGERVCVRYYLLSEITDQIQSLSFHVLHIPKYLALAPRCVAATVSHHNGYEQMGRIPAT